MSSIATLTRYDMRGNVPAGNHSPRGETTRVHAIGSEDGCQVAGREDMLQRRRQPVPNISCTKNVAVELTLQHPARQATAATRLWLPQKDATGEGGWGDKGRPRGGGDVFVSGL